MKCSYCSNELKRGAGLMYVFRIGKINYYCSNRCFKYDIVLHRKVRGIRKKVSTAVQQPVKEQKAKK